MKKLITLKNYRWLLVLTLCTIGSSLMAQKNWVGVTSTDWNTASNWSGGVVPTATDVAIIRSNATRNPIITTSVTVKSIVIEDSNNSLTIATGSSLTIANQTTNTPFNNSGTVNNNGEIKITGLASTSSLLHFGINNYSSGVFNNNASGIITIDGDGIFISSSGTFTNAGTMKLGANNTIISSSGVGIENVFNGKFTNKAGGQIIINYCNTAISNSSSSTNTNSFTNEGKIIIGDIGALNAGIYVTSGTFSNSSTGEVNIDRTNGRGIENRSSFTNAGKITIGAIASLSGDGIGNFGPFNNSASGTIAIDNYGSSNYGINNNINSMFTNSGKIIIGLNSKVPNSYGMTNSNVFDNGVGAEISIDNVTSTCISNSSTLSNNGKIIIGKNIANGSSGISSTLSSNGTKNVLFTNGASGEISIDRITGQSISCIAFNTSYTSKFDNLGKITIGSNGNVGNYGIYLQAAQFNNSGDLKISRAASYGVYVTSAATFTNTGKITLGESSFSSTADNLYVTGASTFNNNTCSANISILSNSIIYTGGTGVINNSGVIIENAMGGSNITSNTGIVQNLNGGTFSVGTGSAAMTTAVTVTNQTAISTAVIANGGNTGLDYTKDNTAWQTSNTFTGLAAGTYTFKIRLQRDNACMVSTAPATASPVPVVPVPPIATTCATATSDIGNAFEKGTYVVNVPAAGTYNIRFTYASWENPAGATATVMVNGTARPSLSLPATASHTVYRDMVSAQTLVAGNNTVVLSGTGDGFYRVTKLCAEAVSSTLPSCAELTSSIGNAFEKGIYTVSVPSAGAYTIRMTYSSWENPAGAVATVMLNGVAGPNVALPATASPAVYRDVTFSKVLVAGTNTLTLSGIAGNFYRVTKVCAEATSTTPTTGPIIDEKTSDMGNPTEKATYTFFIPKAGAYNLLIKYTSWENPAGATMVISVDGGNTSSEVYPATSGPSVYVTRTSNRQPTFTVGDHSVTIWTTTGFMRVVSVSATIVPTSARIGASSEPSERAEVGVEAYPNPATDVLHLSYTLPYDSPVEIGLYDILGQPHTKINQVGRTGPNQTDVPVNKLPVGVYLLRLNYGSQSKTTKVLINR